MILNSSIGVGASFVPLVGDIFLAVWKANSRNAVLLEEYLRIRGEELLREERARQLEQQEQDQQRQRDAAGVTQSNFTTTMTTTTTTTAVDTHSSSCFTGRNDKPISFFSFSRWRARPEPEQKEARAEQPAVDAAADPSRIPQIGCASTSPPPELVDDDDLPVPPSSLGHESLTSEGGNGKKRGFFSSLSRGKAPPAGEKGRFVEHVPEANHGQWGSLPVQ
jgi:hypothetical protein